MNTKTISVSRSVNVDVDVEVEVDLNEFSDDDLIAHLEGRWSCQGIMRATEKREAMLRALWAKDDAKAIEILKDYLCDFLGRAAI